MFHGIPIYHVLIVSTALFFIGVYGFFTRTNLIMILMSLELMINGICVNFIVFSKYLFSGTLDGMFFVIFIITIAAAEAAIAIAILLNLYRNFHTIYPEELKTLQDHE